MKYDIILAGVGGQGILSIAKVIGDAALDAGLYLKQAEVHGMSQRGGDVQSHLRLSDKEIFSDLVPINGADIILSVEPMESLRYLPYLSGKGRLITNSTPFKNISNYPQDEDVVKEIKNVKGSLLMDADSIAKDLGNPRGMNMVMAGAASYFMEIPFNKFEEGIKATFASKGEEIIEKNLKCLRAGRKFAEENC